MDHKFTLDENDFLTYQLYTASISGYTNKRRRITWISLTGVTFALGALLYDREDPIIGYYFAVIGVLVFAFYPLYSRRRYRNFFRNHIQRHYSERFGKEVILRLEEDQIYSFDDGSETIVKLTELRAIVELPEHYLLGLEGGNSFILSKNKVENPKALKEEVEALSRKTRISIRRDTDWKWR